MVAAFVGKFILVIFRLAGMKKRQPTTRCLVLTKGAWIAITTITRGKLPHIVNVTSGHKKSPGTQCMGGFSAPLIKTRHCNVTKDFHYVQVWVINSFLNTG
jgi:hypothetical protein